MFRRAMPTLFLSACLAAAPAVAGQGYEVCRGADGKPYFTDRGCPTDTVSEGAGYAAEAQGYSGPESIDTGVLNQYEGRHGTGRSWSWQRVPEPPR